MSKKIRNLVLRIFYMCVEIAAIIRVEITAEISFVLRYDLIEILSPVKKLFVCMYIDRPEKESENEISASFSVFDTKHRAEIFFVALLTSKNGIIKL